MRLPAQLHGITLNPLGCPSCCCQLSALGLERLLKAASGIESGIARYPLGCSSKTGCLKAEGWTTVSRINTAACAAQCEPRQE